FRCTLLRPTLPGSTRWRSGSTELPNRPFAAGRFATLKNSWRKSTPSCKPPTPPPDPLFGPPRPTRSWLRSNDYVNVFPGRHTRWLAVFHYWQTAQARSGCCKDGISYGGRERRNSGLAHAAGPLVATHNVGFDVRSLVH